MALLNFPISNMVRHKHGSQNLTELQHSMVLTNTQVSLHLRFRMVHWKKDKSSTKPVTNNKKGDPRMNWKVHQRVHLLKDNLAGWLLHQNLCCVFYILPIKIDTSCQQVNTNQKHKLYCCCFCSRTSHKWKL